MEIKLKLFYHLSHKNDPSLITYLYNGFGGPLATFLNKMNISANAVTIFRGLLLPYALYCFSRGELFYYSQGILILILNAFLDTVDGDLARLSKKESVFGEWLEILTGNPVASIHGLAGFFMAWGVYKQTEMVEVWYVLFFIVYAVIMNQVFSSFDIHENIASSSLQEGSQEEYNKLMKNPFIHKLYFTVMQLNEYIILICIILWNPIRDSLGINPLFLALLIICVIYQIRWLLRVFLQGKFVLITALQRK